MTTTTDLESDLHARWLPSTEQRARARALLIGLDPQPEHVYTAHLLVNKRQGFWTADVEVIALDGVFLDRVSCWRFLGTAAEAYHTAAKVDLTGGYAVHYIDHDGNEQASVFEDSVTIYQRTA